MRTEARQASDLLIVALDFDDAAKANELIDELGDLVDFYKVGWQLFIGAGWDFVKSLMKRGKRVFLDLKIGDIEETVRAALNNMPKDLGGTLEFITIHGNGGTVKAAKAGRSGSATPKILALTALSSWDSWDLKDFLGQDSVDLSDYIKLKARQALNAGSDGLIASGESVRDIRDWFKEKDFIIVTPGIRPMWSKKDDHKRALTPREAICSGADYLVVGRPITRSQDRARAARLVLEEIDSALKERAQVDA